MQLHLHNLNTISLAKLTPGKCFMRAKTFTYLSTLNEKKYVVALFSPFHIFAPFLAPSFHGQLILLSNQVPPRRGVLAGLKHNNYLRLGVGVKN